MLQASYQYDAMGRQAIRTLTSPTAITIHSVFDSDGRRIAEYNAGTGALIREYVWNGWDPIAVIEGGVVSFVRADHIGRPAFATNASGVKVWTATYTPFGGVTTSTGVLPSARFPGQWFQSESGLHQNWMRDYDPTTGRYLEADPLGLVDGASVYGYARQSPMMFADPRGECAGPLVVACVSAAGAAIYMIWGWLESSECDPYTWEKAGWDAFDGAVAGATVSSAGAAYNAWRAARYAGQAANALVRFAFPGVTKAEARVALASYGLPIAQAAAVRTAVVRANGASTVKVTQFGADVLVQIFRPGRNGFQVMESLVSPNGVKTVVQRAYDAAGRLVHFDPKF